MHILSGVWLLKYTLNDNVVNREENRLKCAVIDILVIPLGKVPLFNFCYGGKPDICIALDRVGYCWPLQLYSTVVQSENSIYPVNFPNTATTTCQHVS